MFVAIILLIHWQHRQQEGARRALASHLRVAPQVLQQFFPSALKLADAPSAEGMWDVLDSADGRLGYVVQTSPEADKIIGFSGPTNVLLPFDLEDRLLGISILSSGDTRDHVQEVLVSERFMHAFDGLTWEEAAALTRVDAVSGATLTSLAIAESISLRLGGRKPSLRFPEPITAQAVQPIFPDAAAVTEDAEFESLWHIQNAAGTPLGSVLRTSPTIDNLVGYQGPTDALIGFTPDGKIAGIALGKSFDNEPYVGYVRDDWYFPRMFNDLTLAELAEFDLEEAGIEGVSGATMTSMAVARGIIRAAQAHREARTASANTQSQRSPSFDLSPRNLGTVAVVVGGLVLGFTSLRGRKSIRVPFQLLLIGYLGFVNGDLLSQAMLVGWAQNGVPYRTATGLALLTVAALAIPMLTKTNIYCSQLCPHGAAQQLLRNRLPWRVKLSSRVSRLLSMIPGLLLVWVLLVAMAALPFSLVGIEPFNAYLIRIAGWATVTIAIVGLVASLFVPMAYCRYGCPTGALLDFLRYHGRSDQFTPRDALAAGCLLAAVGLFYFL